VSPSELANGFVQEIFRIAGFHYKENFFTESSLGKALRNAGLTSVGGSNLVVDQAMNVVEWLEKKKVSRLRQDAIISRIQAANANSKLSRQMQFSHIDDMSKFTMLRRQFCSVLHF